MGKKIASLKILLVLLIVCLPIISFAQSNQQNNHGIAEEQYEAGSEDFNATQIRSYVAARTEIDHLRGQYAERIGRTRDIERARELQDDFRKKAAAIVEKHGLDIETYNAIVQAIQEDTKLQKKVGQEMEQKR